MILIKAQVSAVHRQLYKVIFDHSKLQALKENEGVEIIPCKGLEEEKIEVDAVLKSGIYFNEMQLETFPTVGDYVELEYNPDGPSRIVRTLERQTYFSRKDPDPGRGEQAVAANFDYVFLVTSLNHDFNVKRMERYLTVAWQSGAQPVIILTKADLVDDIQPYLDELAQTAIGVEIIPVSAKTGYGMEELSPFITAGKTIVCLGSSGVGKSSLLNALAGKEVMATSSIREDDSKGHHTTTHRQLIFLPQGTKFIDTPGMRELGMWDVSKGIEEAFQDIEELILGCKFSDCTHTNEPGCKINQALENGSLPRERWQNYLKLKKEARYSENKIAYLQSVKAWGKSIAKYNKQRKQKR